MKKLKKESVRSNAKQRVAAYEELITGEHELKSRILLIQQLIPLGLLAVEEMLQDEVLQLAGERYSRGHMNKRWGSNPGSVYLGDQKCSIKVPRVRNEETGEEVELERYHQFQSSQIIDERVFSHVLNGISTRKYEKAAEKVPETFGIKRNSVSKKFIKESAKKLKELNQRDLSGEEIIAIFMDGKTFAENEMIIALGITLEGKKVILGMVETHTENGKVCQQFLNELKGRGLKDEHKILFIIDGAKGLRKGILKVFRRQAVIMRCQWHKRENIVAYLPKEKQEYFREQLRNAYQQKTYDSAKKRLNLIRKQLEVINESAVNSLDEGLEETLTLHRLGVFEVLGTSFKTTNCIESINGQLEQYTHRVSYWKNSNQRQRWRGRPSVATALLEIEPNLRKVKGYKALPKLRKAMESQSFQKFLPVAA